MADKMLLPPIAPGRFCDRHWLGLLATLRLKHFQDNDHMISKIIQNPTNLALNVRGGALQDGDGSFSPY
jgi:hypothetical protein